MTPQYVHVVAWPAADGDGVRMTAYRDEAEARDGLRRLRDTTNAWLHTLRINEKETSA